jgi:hypothetical protein
MWFQRQHLECQSSPLLIDHLLGNLLDTSIISVCVSSDIHGNNFWTHNNLLLGNSSKFFLYVITCNILLTWLNLRNLAWQEHGWAGAFLLSSGLVHWRHRGLMWHKSPPPVSEGLLWLRHYSQFSILTYLFFPKTQWEWSWFDSLLINEKTEAEAGFQKEQTKLSYYLSRFSLHYEVWDRGDSNSFLVVSPNVFSDCLPCPGS